MKKAYFERIIYVHLNASFAWLLSDTWSRSELETSYFTLTIIQREEKESDQESEPLSLHQDRDFE